MSDYASYTLCEDCSSLATSEPNYCPDCGAGPDPWQEEARNYFERDVDLPMIIEDERYDDDYGLWREFCQQAFGHRGLKESTIKNMPDGFPRMKHCTIRVYWKLTEDYNLKGPYMNKQDARNA
jgi:hypothetical protein